MKVLATAMKNSQLLPLRSFRSSGSRPLASAAFALLGILHAPAIAIAQAATAANAPAAGTAVPEAAKAAAPSAELREKARTAYFAGKSAYAAGNFAEAEQQFELANSFISAVQAQYWRALSLHEQGKSAEALVALGLIISHPSRGKLRSEQLKDAAARHAQLQSAPADVTLRTAPAGAKVTVNGQVINGPTPTSLRLAPGQHEVTVALAGYETQRFLLNAAPGAKISPSVQLVPVPSSSLGAPPLSGSAAEGGPSTSGLSAPAPIAASSADAYSRPPHSVVPAAVTLGIAGVGAVVGTIFGIRALNEKKKFNDSPSYGGADDTERNALIADMAFGVSLTLGITGAVLLLTGDSAGDSASREGNTGEVASSDGKLQLLPFATPNSAGAAAILNF